MLVTWFRLIFRCQPLIELYYQPWSYVAMTGMSMLKKAFPLVFIIALDRSIFLCYGFWNDKNCTFGNIKTRQPLMFPKYIKKHLVEKLCIDKLKLNLQSVFNISLTKVLAAYAKLCRFFWATCWKEHPINICSR